MSQSRPCETCGESDYYEQGGFFYCQECNTQSQGMRLIEASTEHFDGLGAHRSLYKKVDRLIGDQEKEETDHGIPWTTHDAFALLLQAQSVALVKFGAPPSFPLLVEKLWKRYESRRAGTPLPRERDTALDQSKGVLPITKWRAFRKSCGKWPSTVDPKALSREERKEWKVQGGLSEEQAEEEEKEEEGRKRSGEDGEKKEVERGTLCHLAEMSRFQRIERMRMGYSLCFLYIALLHLKSHITLGDLIRWSEQCFIPYLNPLDYFPENMKFSTYDLETFARSKRVPSSSKLRKDTGRLIFFLQLNPHPVVDVRRLVARYVMDMNLPNAIVKLSSKLMSVAEIASPTHRPRKGKTNTIPVPNYEAIAVTVVLMCLKLVFRLDGVTEFALSHLVCELDKHVDDHREKTGASSSTLFVFEDWFQMAGDAVLKLKSRQFPNRDEIVSNGDANGGVARDVAYLSRYYTHSLVNKLGSVRRSVQLPRRDHLDALQDSLADLLIGDADLSAPKVSNTASSFPVAAAAAAMGPDHDALADDVVAEEEWRRSVQRSCGGDGGGRAGGDVPGRNRLADKELGILTEARLQRDLVKNDFLLSKLNLPAYEIDETGKAESSWAGTDGMRDVARRLEINRRCLNNLFSHQRYYCFMVERDKSKERKRYRSDSHKRFFDPHLCRPTMVKEAILHTSATVGILVELCALMIGQEPRELLVDVFLMERKYQLVRQRATPSASVRRKRSRVNNN